MSHSRVVEHAGKLQAYGRSLDSVVALWDSGNHLGFHRHHYPVIECESDRDEEFAQYAALDGVAWGLATVGKTPMNGEN